MQIPLAHRVPHSIAFAIGLCSLIVVGTGHARGGAVEDWAEKVAFAPETPTAAAERHERVAKRRAQVQVICHRGAWEFATENTLEAYRATFELGADGNEIDIRSTKDGVIVCFHDDMLDHALEAYGDVADYTWDELQRCRFRDSGPFGEQCRIPTLVEVFELHRQRAGLMHLDIKRPGQDRAIARLLDRMDMWDHVVVAPGDIGAAIVKDKRFHGGQFKASMYEDHSELFPEAVAEALAKPGDMLMLEDPRGVLLTLNRKRGVPSTSPVSPVTPVVAPADSEPSSADIQQAIATLRDAADWNMVPKSPEEQARSAARILARAQAADTLSRMKQPSTEVIDLLEERVRNRSMHPDWRHHGLDGASALRALFVLKSDRAVPLARFCLMRDDPELAKVQNPMYKSPRAWTDFRVKMIVFRLLKEHRPPGTADLCREYLALSHDQAYELSPLQYDAATQALLAANTNLLTAIEVLSHPRRDARGRAILVCLKNIDQAWAENALHAVTPYALNYVVKNR